jgi:uncharacterized protein YjbI with pentapeptide repeats
MFRITELTLFIIVNSVTELSNLYNWDEVELKKITFEKKHFAAGSFTNLDFEAVRFVNCGFSDCDFEHLVMTDTIFENCELEKCVFTDVTFHESRFSGCKILDGGFNEINMADESLFGQCDLDSCDFSGGIFSETGVTRDTRFYRNTFTQISLSRAAFENCQFIESTFSKSTFYDSRFINCQFNTITHDFKLSDPPMLCDFRGTKFLNMTMPRTFRIWNNFKQHPKAFYLKTVGRLLKDNHPNHLKELGLALQHLEKFPEIDANGLRLEIKELFKQLAADAGHAGNYEIIGEILSAYGRVPERFRTQTGFFLPAANESEGLEPGMARLRVKLDLNNWTVKQVSQIMALMAEIEDYLPEGPEQVIDTIEEGSFIIEILAGLKSLLAYFQSLVDFGKSTYELRLKVLEIESKKIDLEYQRRLKEQELAKNDLTIATQKIELYTKIKEHYGYDHLAYGKTPKGKKATAIAETIKHEFPILHVRLEDQ